MKNGLFGIAIAVAVGAAIAAGTSAFVVDPTRQALVLQFGQVKRAITESGLYFKVPFIQNVEYLDRRILDLDMESQEVIASDQKRLIVDAFARYRIADPVQFYQTVRTVQGGAQRLNTFTSSALRAVLADATFSSVVRDDRAQLMDKIKEAVDIQAKTIGVDIIDVRIRRADLPAQNSQAIFQRMKTERQREATELRARGAEESQRIRSKSDADKEIILAEARRDSERLRGEGDAQRNRVFAEAFGRDPEFFAFYRSMQAYAKSLGSQGTTMVLNPDSEFFRYFGAQNAGAPAGSPGRPPAPTPLPAPAQAEPAPAQPAR